MKITSKYILSVVVALITACLCIPVDGCKQEAPTFPDPGTLPAPVVDSLSPAGSALAGIDTITIYGKNFSANRANDGVYFNSTLINNTSIAFATTTKLVVKAPPISGNTISVRVFVIGAVDFSPTFVYALVPAIIPFGTFAGGEGAYGLCTGPDTNLYASLSNSTLPVNDEGIFKMTSAGAIVPPPYILPTKSTLNTLWSSLKFGPGGIIYAVKNTPVVFKLVPGQLNPGATNWAVTNIGASVNDMDFDPNHNIWLGGGKIKNGSDTTNIVKVLLTATVTKYHFTGTVRAVRYFNGELYFAAVSPAGASQIWHAPIVADTLQTPQVYFDVSTLYAGSVPVIWGITFSADGDLYVGMDAPDYLIVVHPGGIPEKTYQLYVTSGVLNAPCKAFAWVGTTLYASTPSGTMFKISTGKPGAPYYGIQ